MNRTKTLYKLTVEDFQNVAIDEIGRKLNREEMEIVKSSVEKKIFWYSLIADSITENRLTPCKRR